MDKNQIQIRAEAAAKKICVRGCYAGYESCKKPQHTAEIGGAKSELLPFIGEDNGCPLAKYNVPDAPVKPFPACLGSEPTLDDCFWLCAACDNGVFEEDEEGYSVNKPNWATVCLDCPVQQTKDSISEAQAEAMMS